jgi:hypothetical protein
MKQNQRLAFRSPSADEGAKASDIEKEARGGLTRLIHQSENPPLRPSNSPVCAMQKKPEKLKFCIINQLQIERIMPLDLQQTYVRGQQRGRAELRTRILHIVQTAGVALLALLLSAILLIASVKYGVTPDPGTLIE